jgi:hypothetical protein
MGVSLKDLMRATLPRPCLSVTVCQRVLGLTLWAHIPFSPTERLDLTIYTDIIRSVHITTL